MKTLDVIFRSDTPSASAKHVTAVFPSLPGTNDPNTATCYAHIGQHSACSREWYRTTRDATPEEYASLLRELRNIYETPDPHDERTETVRLRIVSRWTARHDRMRREALQETRK
jgi:hypothetical protein